MEDCHKHTHLNKRCVNIFNKDKTNHKANAEADDANNHAVVAKQILVENVIDCWSKVLTKMGIKNYQE